MRLFMRGSQVWPVMPGSAGTRPLSVRWGSVRVVWDFVPVVNERRDFLGGYTSGTQGSRKRPFKINVVRGPDPFEGRTFTNAHAQPTVA
jgi:hypothetical protein